MPRGKTYSEYNKKYWQLWYRKNKKKRVAQVQEWNNENKEKRKKYQKTYRERVKKAVAQNLIKAREAKKKPSN